MDSPLRERAAQFRSPAEFTRSYVVTFCADVRLDSVASDDDHTIVSGLNRLNGNGRGLTRLDLPFGFPLTNDLAFQLI